MKIAGGAALGQFALALSLPVVARLYSPSDIGRFAVVLGVSQLLSILVTGRVEQMMPRVSGPARWPLMRLVVGLTLILPPLLAALAFLVVGREHFLVLVLLVATNCLMNIAGFVLLSYESFGPLARSRGINGVLTALLQVVGGMVAPSVETLCLTYAAGSLVGALFCLGTVGKVRAEGLGRNWSALHRERPLAFAATVGIGALFSNAAITLPTIVIAEEYGASAAASFFLARRLLMVPVQLLSKSVGDVNYAALVKLDRPSIAEELARWLRKFMVPCVLMVIFGLGVSPVVPVLLGSDYPQLAVTFALLVCPAVMQFVAVSFSNVLIVLHREGLNLIWNVCRLAALGVLLWGISRDVGYAVGVGAYGIFSIVSYASLLWLTVRTANAEGRAV